MFGAVENTRHYKRFQVNYLIKYWLPEAPEEVYVANAKDISASGVRFWSEKFFSEGSKIAISILVPPIGKTIESLVRIIRVRRVDQGLSLPIYYMASEFLTLSPEDKTELNDFIEGLSRIRGAQRFVDHKDKFRRQSRAYLYPETVS